VARGATNGMQAAANLAKTRLRNDVRQGGFKDGRKLANTWRAEVYPNSGQTSLTPAAQIYSRAPHIIAAHENGATIRPVNGSRYLWIPTENVPRAGRGGKLMSIPNVEERFGDFDYVPGGRAGTFLAVVEAVRRKTTRGRTGIRRFSAARARRGDVADTIHMYTLVPMVRLPKRLNGRSIRDDIAMRVLPRLVAQGIGQELRRPGGR
jgi:hypothetical protein